MSNGRRSTKFAPSDLTDGRGRNEWATRYADPAARRAIRCEAIYLSIHLFGALLVTSLLYFPKSRAVLGLTGEDEAGLLKYGNAWTGGILGGTMFGAKWLYHVVAKNLWNRDRRLWRLFTPHISGVLAVVVAALISSKILMVFDPDALRSRAAAFGVGFLVGYFSDSTIAKLTEVAETLFGTTSGRSKHFPIAAEPAQTGATTAQEQPNTTASSSTRVEAQQRALTQSENAPTPAANAPTSGPRES